MSGKPFHWINKWPLFRRVCYRFRPVGHLRAIVSSFYKIVCYVMFFCFSFRLFLFLFIVITLALILLTWVYLYNGLQDYVGFVLHFVLCGRNINPRPNKCRRILQLTIMKQAQLISQLYSKFNWFRFFI